jgi:hypothetical protein
MPGGTNNFIPAIHIHIPSMSLLATKASTFLMQTTTHSPTIGNPAFEAPVDRHHNHTNVSLGYDEQAAETGEVLEGKGEFKGEGIEAGGSKKKTHHLILTHKAIGNYMKLVGVYFDENTDLRFTNFPAHHSSLW